MISEDTDDTVYILVRTTRKDMAPLRRIIHESGMQVSDMVFRQDRKSYFGIFSMKEYTEDVARIFHDVMDAAKFRAKERLRKRND